LGLAVFYLIRGPLDVPPEEKRDGRLIERFAPMDRYAHWLMAITWVTLAITGLILTLGKSVLLPVIGYTLFSWLAILAKNLHNFVGPILCVALPVMIVVFLHENLPRAYDWAWMKKFGGLFDRSGAHAPPSGKANAGQKVL